MPHLIVQATPNVYIPHEESLLKTLNTVLWDSGEVQQKSDIKARMLPITTFLVGTDDDEQRFGYVYIELKLMTGRSEATKNALAEQLLIATEEKLAKAQSGRVQIQVCVEVTEISQNYHKKFITHIE
ncbi:5-carboxymethyl-2-hydroxymuconate isomerase [Psychrobacter aestuarii]|uniref:5-carboxymethyl-2-hydroxymuconate isomerase n=1 Tax=Psychrobacter aestuarii TaxID=556327 RepID=A0ABN0W245_9GAMM|nr:5-carboxymethyl-2-hydroxymuconate isomerase [Psychrobacter aestuarii]